MKDIKRYQIMREFRSEHKIGDNLEMVCPDPKFWHPYEPARCYDLCRKIWPELIDITGEDEHYCPCKKWGCSTALRKLDAWLRKEKAQLGVAE